MTILIDENLRTVFNLYDIKNKNRINQKNYFFIFIITLFNFNRIIQLNLKFILLIIIFKI